MSVDFLVCDVCGESFADCSGYWHCSNCDGMVCEDCYDGQKDKYGILDDDDEKSDYYGEALKKCDYCVTEEKNTKLNNDIIHVLDYILYLTDVKNSKLMGHSLSQWVNLNIDRIDGLIKQLKEKNGQI